MSFKYYFNAIFMKAKASVELWFSPGGFHHHFVSMKERSEFGNWQTFHLTDIYLAITWRKVHS